MSRDVRTLLVAALVTVLLILLALALPAKAASITTVEYASGHLMDVYAPEVPNGTAVVAVHGGGWWTGSRTGMARFCTEIATPNGYTCFAPDYTLSGEAPFPAANRDLLAALDY